MNIVINLHDLSDISIESNVIIKSDFKSIKFIKCIAERTDNLMMYQRLVFSPVFPPFKYRKDIV